MASEAPGKARFGVANGGDAGARPAGQVPAGFAPSRRVAVGRRSADPAGSGGDVVGGRIGRDRPELREQRASGREPVRIHPRGDLVALAPGLGVALGRGEREPQPRLPQIGLDPEAAAASTPRLNWLSRTPICAALRNQRAASA